MSVYLSTCIGIGSPTDFARVEFTGNDDDIPYIEFSEGIARAYVALHFDDPAAQIDWLRNLAAECERLAVEVAVLHGEAVAS